MRILLLGVLIFGFLAGVIGGVFCLLMAAFMWYAPWVGVGLAAIIVGLASGLGATYL